jgi:uncharacterized membrane protein
MEGFLLFVLIVVLIVRWAMLSRRYSEMEERIAMVIREHIEPKEITKLIKRITQLEETVAELKRARPVEVVEAPAAAKTGTLASPAVMADKAAAKPEAPPKPVVVPEPAPRPVAIPVVAPEPKSEPPKPSAPPAPHVPVAPPVYVAPLVRAAPSRTSAEWEALVGGNWTNKIGVLVLVISIALFLGYEFPRLGPGGISAISLALSFTLLVGGVLLERRARYLIFGRGLLAGGWAGLYFTTYAMQALDAAKVIHNPVLGALLLLAVAVGMVVHSLRYREQAVTGFAYFMAFLTLAITQLTALSVIALIPLAGSLLFIAYRFEWAGMALFGLVATYVTCATKPDTGAPLWSAQTVFAAYWLLFEGYDLLRARRRWNHPAQQAMLPLNALGLGLLSYAKWSKAAPDDLHLLAIGVAVAYLASTILRAILRGPASFAAGTGTMQRILAGGFEGPITLAAASSAAAAVFKLEGQTVNNVLLAEGELLFLAGLFFRQSYPRRLAATLFGALGIKLFASDIPNAGAVAIAGRTLKDWTPSAALAALLFYANRGLRKAGRSYGYFASALVALIVGYEVSLRYVGISWLSLGAVLFLVGWRWRLPDFRIHGYLTGMLAVGGIAVYQFAIFTGSAVPLLPPWISLACAAAIAYLAALCALRSAADRFTPAEREQLQFTASAVASAAGVALLWKVVPEVYLGPAWMTLALVALELGLRNWPPEFRWHAYLLGALGAGRVLFFTVLPFHSIHATPERIAIGGAALLAYVFAARVFAESRRALDVASACGSFFVLVELWVLLDPVLVAPVWALFALLLTEVGFHLDVESLRVQGHAAALAALGRLGVVNFDAAHRIPAVAVVVAAHYFESWRHQNVRERLREWERSLDRPYLYTAAGLIVVLLYKELQAPYVAVGWALLTVVLLGIGRAIDWRDLRYQSYGLAVLAFGRVLALEFSPAEIFASVDQRIAVGGAVAACLFVAQFLISQERLSRLFYSLLATGLATALLFQEVSGSMLTVAWGIEGAVLLGLGFLLRDRTFRLSGLVLFLVCVGKLFVYDLRALETLYRILSFFVLGVILVGVSWLYTRFRDQIQRYL